MTRCELGSRPKIPLIAKHNRFNTIPSHGVEAMCGPERLPSPDCRVPCGARDRGKWGSVRGSPVWSRDCHGIYRGAKARKTRMCERMRSRPHFWPRSQQLAIRNFQGPPQRRDVVQIAGPPIQNRDRGVQGWFLATELKTRGQE
jgi:hypothetical protein